MTKEVKDTKKEVKDTKTKKETKKEPNKNIHEISIKIEGKEWAEALDKVFAKKQKTAKVDGFRPGKVPRNIYEKHYGKESLYLDAADLVLQNAYLKAIKDSDLVPVAEPTVDLKGIDDKKVEFVFKIVTAPEVTIKKYKGLNIKPDKVEVTDEEINDEVAHLLEKYTELIVKENGTVENGNVAIIDFEGFKDGVAFDGGKGENYSLEIGSNTFIPGFEEQIIGMKQGEEKDLNLTFPEDYGAKDLAGKDVVFKVKVNEIKEKEQRKLDKDFFEDLAMDGINSEASLRKEIKTSLETQKQAATENKYLEDLLEAIGKNVEVDIPQQMVDDETNRLLGRFEEQLKMQGISLDLYYNITKTKEEDLRTQLEKEAYNNVLYRLMLEEIMKKENIEVTKEESDKKLEELAKEYKMSKAEFTQQFGGIDMVQYDLKLRKTIELLKELNK